MFNELVDKIVVYEAEGAGNARTQKVDIYFNYVGQVDIAYTEEELAELKAQKEQEEGQRMEKQRKCEKAYPCWWKLPSPACPIRIGSLGSPVHKGQPAAARHAAVPVSAVPADGSSMTVRSGAQNKQ